MSRSGVIDLAADHGDALRVLVIGAESTGKSTLCADLGAALGAPVVGEFGRAYTEAMPDPPRYEWSHTDFVTIARTQLRIEDDTGRWAQPVVICDTSAFTTALFHEAYLGDPAPDLLALAAGRDYDLTILCDLDTPFVQDTTAGIRDKTMRAWMQEQYEADLERRGVTPVRVAGAREDRAAQALAAVTSLVTPTMAS